MHKAFYMTGCTTSHNWFKVSIDFYHQQYLPIDSFKIFAAWNCLGDLKEKRLWHEWCCAFLRGGLVVMVVVIDMKIAWTSTNQ